MKSIALAVLSSCMTALILGGCSSAPAVQRSITPTVIIAKQSLTTDSSAGIEPDKLYVSSTGCISMRDSVVVVPPRSTYSDGAITLPTGERLIVGEVPSTSSVVLIAQPALIADHLPAEFSNCDARSVAWFYPLGTQ